MRDFLLMVLVLFRSGVCCIILLHMHNMHFPNSYKGLARVNYHHEVGMYSICTIYRTKNAGSGAQPKHAG